MKLEKIAKINTGLLTTRKKAKSKNLSKGIYKLLTVNAIDNYGNINLDKLDDFYSNEKISNQYLTKKGKIYIRMNEPYTSIYIDEENEGILFPAYFVEIELRNINFLPEYIDWYLNSDKNKRNYLKAQSGTLIPSINQKIIREIEIPEKTLEEQEKILNVYKLFKKQMELLDNLKIKEEQKFKAITDKLIEG
ncbi:restriction endonuclease subunit S [Peptoniphilus stercorisuis]|uniref:Restriction endonuclease S subunit n=1 Tax=Peptoniphilus stercorisuis TaxID=1436965 RepID=A0ABS4KBX6_9FIRM|nr:restriction endonuclease subunit S [Peptoniphilus stercorisuis]MBP2025288.1 restriction endonuclease S subunit [Peptoniphilus stercorisuis]